MAAVIPFIPLIIGAVSAAGAVAGGVIAAKGSERQAKAEQRSAEIAAREEERVSRERVDQLKRKRGRILASQRAAVTGRGVKLSGSPLELLAETNETIDLDINRLRRQSKAQAVALRRGGRQALQLGRTRATTSLISGIGRGIQTFSGQDFSVLAPKTP